MLLFVAPVLESLSCSSLRAGQFKCDRPKIDSKKQQLVNCSADTLTAPVYCRPAPGIFCDGRSFTGKEIGFVGNLSCRYVTAFRFDVTLILSIFGGIFGLDRFYLGYPALGILKLWTLGGFGLWYLADILFIATGVIRPADNSSLLHPYYNPPITLLESSNTTVFA